MPESLQHQPHALGLTQSALLHKNRGQHAHKWRTRAWLEPRQIKVVCISGYRMLGEAATCTDVLPLIVLACHDLFVGLYPRFIEYNPGPVPVTTRVKQRF